MNPFWWTTYKMNSCFSSLFTTVENVNLSYTLVGTCLLTRNLYILIVLLVSDRPLSAVGILRLQSPMVLVKSKLLTKAWGQDGWMLSKFFSSCLLTETESRSAIEERAQHIFIKGIIKFLKKLWCCVGMEYYRIILFSSLLFTKYDPITPIDHCLLSVCN